MRALVDCALAAGNPMAVGAHVTMLLAAWKREGRERSGACVIVADIFCSIPTHIAFPAEITALCGLGRSRYAFVYCALSTLDAGISECLIARRLQPCSPELRSPFLASRARRHHITARQTTRLACFCAAAMVFPRSRKIPRVRRTWSLLHRSELDIPSWLLARV